MELQSDEFCLSSGLAFRHPRLCGDGMDHLGPGRVVIAGGAHLRLANHPVEGTSLWMGVGVFTSDIVSDFEFM